MKAEPIDLATRPTSLTVAGRDTIAVVNAIRERGGHVAGMAQGERNGVWKLRVEWPDEKAKMTGDDEAASFYT
jgi:hypothetical protein